MGFYGNITNTSKTQFQFDRVYDNRMTMEKRMAEDGIYIGRYVLVDYNQKNAFNYRYFYKDIVNGKYYMWATATDLTEVKYPNDVQQDEIVRITTKKENNSKLNDSEFELYQCTNTGNQIQIATFKKLSNSDNPYTMNYEIDIAKYGHGRGWDSTVWQKVYIGGQAKYVMIAELNSVVPTFSIVKDAPTLAPIAPHFDLSSNDFSYKVHFQPNWGMRIKSATDANVPSDQKVIWINETYDPEEDIENVTETEIDGAIYYNKAGFNPETISYSSVKEDKISIEATGRSGQVYNLHNGTNGAEFGPKEDIQEISIILPSIGDSISQMWNLVYGDEKINNGKERNLDIAWDSTNGLRMVKEKEDGNGWTYDTEPVNTLAGGINAIHDLMGMIIETLPEEELDLTKINADKIYYNSETGTYCYKEKDYDFIPLEENKDFIFKQVENLTLDTYRPDTYYIEIDGIKIPDINGIYDSSKTYFIKELQIQPQEEIKKIVEYKNNKYYYLENNKDYYLDNNEKRNDDKVYYDITDPVEKEDLSYTYKVDKYYTKDGEDYIIYSNNLPVENTIYYDLIPTILKDTKPYIPGKFYYYNNEDNTWQVELAERFDENVKYYMFSGNPNVNGDIVGIDVKLFYINDGVYFRNNNETNYRWVTSIPEDEENGAYYNIKANSILKFYLPNFYYYKDNNNWILDDSETMVFNRDYYSIKPVIIDYFYEPKKYYYYNDNTKEYMLDDSETITENRTYYIGIELFVTEDTKYIFNKYALWNNNVKIIPCTIALSKKKDTYVLKELTGFARSLNTIHGLILKVNQLLNFDNEKIRNTETIQGCLNKIHDIIDRFDKLAPKDILIVDALGRIHGAELVGDDWISLKVNDNVNEPKFIVKHTSPIEISPEPKKSLDLKFGEAFSINDLYFDNKGHKCAAGSHDIRIPDLNLELEVPQNILATSKIMTDLKEIESDNIVDKTYLAKFNRVGDLVLDGYEAQASNEYNFLDNTKTINQAFALVENKIIVDTANAMANMKTYFEEKYNTLEKNYNDLLKRIELLEKV